MTTNWPDQIKLELTGMAQGGDAIGRWEGRAVFAAGGLPGEMVEIRLYDRQKAFARGRVLNILEAVPERVASFCPLEQSCSAADWRWIDVSAQRRFKADILREQLQHLGGVDVEVLQPEPIGDVGQTLDYRTTAELHVAGDNIGYFRPGTRRVTDIPSCCLHHPLINEAVAALRSVLDGQTSLRGVTLRCSPAANEVVVTVDGRGPLRALAQRWRHAYPALVGVVQESSRRVLEGRDWIEQRVGMVRFHHSASSFFQINYHQTERMVRRVQELLDAGSTTRVLDLYCGVGLFALSLAPGVGEVLGIEEWAPAIDDARRSASLNLGENVRFEVGSVEGMLARFKQPVDRVVLDPPRRGCAPEVLSALAALAPERIVYVSCHPGTLARDCKTLIAAGYELRSAETIDMFPHTHHVESIVLLARH